MALFATGSIVQAQTADIENARELFKTGRYTECLEATRRAVVNRRSADREYGAEWRILMAETLMVLGQYDEAADEINMSLLRYPMSMRLLQLAHKANLYTRQDFLASEMLRRIYRYAVTNDIESWIPSYLVAIGQSLLELGNEPRTVLEQFYYRAIQNDPNCRQAYLAIAELALDKQDYGFAAEQYREGLRRFGDDPDMHYGLARAFYYSDRDEMLKSLDAALTINPNHPPSLLLLAEHQIDCEYYQQASSFLDRVDKVNPEHPQAWAYRCVLAHLANDNAAAERARATALKNWPENPNVDYLIGLKLSQKYLFAQGEAYQRRALKFDPDYLPAKIQLAQDLLRLGQEQEGWELTEEVYNEDQYNIQAYNLMNLRDHLSNFKTLNTGNFIVRMEEREAEIYGQSVLELFLQAESQLCEKYGLKVDNPVIIEIFPNQQDFAVRTFGIPGIEGFLGVCFGSVITANSPKAEQPSNWESMLWHEFCHVVTLSMTHNKMPRWLSEGISVYEESQRDPTCGQHMNNQYRNMIIEGQLVPISELSAAFLSPPTPVHLQFAYYESSLVVEYIVENFGYEVLKTILAELGDGMEINKALAEHVAPINKLERNFAAFVQERVENLAPDVDWEQPERAQFIAADSNALADWLEKHPNSFWALIYNAKNLLAESRYEQAKEVLTKLIDIYPQYTGQDNAYVLLAEVHRNLGETEQEREVLNKLANISSDALYAYDRLMDIAVEQEDWQAVINNGRKYFAVYPLPAQLHRRLALANEQLGNDQQAIKSYRCLLGLRPPDLADVNYRLGRLLAKTDLPAAKRYVLTALAEAPRFRQAHSLLLKIIEDERELSGNRNSEWPGVREDIP